MKKFREVLERLGLLAFVVDRYVLFGCRFLQIAVGIRLGIEAREGLPAPCDRTNVDDVVVRHQRGLLNILERHVAEVLDVGMALCSLSVAVLFIDLARQLLLLASAQRTLSLSLYECLHRLTHIASFMLRFLLSK